MNCSNIQAQLSAFHDGELTESVQEMVAAHLADCEECASRLAEFVRCTDSFRQLSQPQVPPAVWEGIVANLDQQSSDTLLVTPAAKKLQWRSWLTAGGLAFAASVLLLVGLGFWMPHPSEHSGHSVAFATTMDHYLQKLATDPDQAERFLLDKYNGEIVDPQEAIRLVGYHPAVASGLPDQYTLASTSVMKMPCCTCVKAVCKRRDGSTLVLFEHDDQGTEMLGHRPSSMTTCGDTQCCLVDLDSNIAATWQRGSRWVTAVGARDTAEVSELIAWMENN